MLDRSAVSGTPGSYLAQWHELKAIAPPCGPTVRHPRPFKFQQQPYSVPAAAGPCTTYSPLFTSCSNMQTTLCPSATEDRQTEAPASRQANSQLLQQQHWHELILDSVSDPGDLVKLVLRAKINVSSDAVSANVSYKGPRSNLLGSSSTAFEAGAMPYKQLTMRPVMLKGRVHLQMSLLDSRQDITKNCLPDQAVDQLRQLLQLPWQSASLQATTKVTNIQISKRGKVLVQTNTNQTAAATATDATNHTPAAADGGEGGGGGAIGGATHQQGLRSGLLQQQLFSSNGSSVAPGPISLQHDRVKAVPINGSVPDVFLQKIGLQTADGRIKANMQAKFTQINEFVKLLIHTGQLEHLEQQQVAAAAPGSSSNDVTKPNPKHPSSSSSSPKSDQQQSSNSSSSAKSDQQQSSSSSVHILDCGCGSSHLTFGTYHYLSNIRGLPIQLTGIDTNKGLMERSNRYCEELGISDHARFFSVAIRQYQPPQRPDIVLALHACDTATDESLALGIRSGAKIIMSVPCCHKNLHWQQQQQRQHGSSSVDLFSPMLSHGILRQRMLDLLTDTFRAHLLRLMRYRTDVVEFVSGEHTPRNLLIRAVKQQGPTSAVEQRRLAEQYVQLKQYWGVVPHLEKLLREDGLWPEQMQQG